MTVLAGGLAWATEPTQRGTSASKAAEGVIDPKADSALKRMSDYLAGLRSMRVNTTTIDEKVTTDGRKIQELQQSKVMLERPGALRVERVSPAGHVVFTYDGKQFGIYNKDKNVYATARAPAQLDAAIDDARERLHVDAPGGDLLVSNPYQELIDGTITGHYVGLEPVDGVMAHHLFVTKKDVDWQIWIKDGPDAAPLRYVIVSKDMPGQPQFTIELRDWQPNPQVSANSFVFVPPAGAKRVEFAPLAKPQRQPQQGTGGQP
jgi:hypothetical protein